MLYRFLTTLNEPVNQHVISTETFLNPIFWQYSISLLQCDYQQIRMYFNNCTGTEAQIRCTVSDGLYYCLPVDCLAASSLNQCLFSIPHVAIRVFRQYRFWNTRTCYPDVTKNNLNNLKSWFLSFDIIICTYFKQFHSLVYCCTVWVNFFPNSWEFLTNFLHTYYVIISTLDYKFLFNYLQFWQSYTILSATT